MQTYLAHGLHIRSELPLPDLMPSDCEAPDVVVHHGDAPHHLPNPRLVDGEGEICDASPGRFSLIAPHLASYLAVDGREIWVESVPGSDDHFVRCILLGSVFAALLHQRHILALHASCVQTPRGAVLFAGRSGCGKSTLATAMMQRGYPLLADDVTGLTLDDEGIPTALPAFPTVRLWDDMSAKLSYPLDMNGRPPLPAGKYLFSASTFCSEPSPVSAICFLTPHSGPGIRVESVDGLDRLASIVNSTYRGRFLNALGVQKSHFQNAMKVARFATFWRIRRPSQAFLLEELVDRIEAEIVA